MKLGKSEALTPGQLKALLAKLVECCLVHEQDSYRIHMRRVKGIKKLNIIIARADFSEMSSTMVVQLIWCVMSCIHHFQIWLKLSTGLLQWSRRRLYRKSLSAYDRLIRILMPDMYAVILNAIITFYKNADVWKIEHMCVELLVRLVAYSKDPTLTISEILCFNFAIKNVENCAKHSLADVKVFPKDQKGPNGYQVIDATLNTSIELGDNTRVTTTIDYQSKPTSKWVHLYTVNHEKGICDFLSIVVGEFFYDMQRRAALAEQSLATNVNESKEIIKVLYEILETITWKKMDKVLLERFLAAFHWSVMPSEGKQFLYQPLKKGLEVCVRNLLNNLSNDDLMDVIREILEWTSKETYTTDEMVLEIGNVLEFATILYRSECFADWPPEVMTTVLQLIASENILFCLLGNRVFQHLIDRCNNRENFVTPKIFFPDATYKITVNVYSPDDKVIFRKCRQMFHQNILRAAFSHGDNRVNLENAYTSVALLIVEVPCGYTAAAGVCLAMALQETALADEHMELGYSNRVHATVMAIMTLICYIHRAEVFYEYVNTVLSRRAAYAPHLNPPLRITYEYAEHQILWKKPDLFFEDWETRYGLWKCFRTRKATVQVINGRIVSL